MKFRKNWKRFWSLDRHHAEGFTLVELIVVIAILAILAGVGTVGYSGYVKKANQAADEQLFAEIEKAIHLAFYSDTDGFEGGYISLSMTDDATASSADLENAMIAAFGTNWKQELKIKTNWLASFEGSSYEGREKDLIKAIDSLTDALSATIANLAGTQFHSYMSNLGVDSTDENVVADAAVFYIANQIAGMSSAEKTKYVNSMPAYVSAGSATGIVNGLMTDCMTPVVAAATLYALAEGLCDYLKDEEVTNTFTTKMAELKGQTFEDKEGESAQDQAVNAVVGAMDAAQAKALENGLADKMAEYFQKQASKDMAAYLDILTSVAGADKQVKNSFGTEGCFASLSDLVNTVTSGSVIIFTQEDEGKFTVINSALDTKE